MDSKASLLLVFAFLSSGAIVGVCPQDDGSGLPTTTTTTERQELLDQPRHHQHHFNPSGRQQTPHHHQRPAISMTPHHQTGMHQSFASRYTPNQHGYSSAVGMNPYPMNGVASWPRHPSSTMDSSRPASIPLYGHAPMYFHPPNVPLRQYTTKVFRTHRRGSAVIPYEGASVRVPATWGQRKAHSGTIRTSVWPAGSFSTYSRHYNPPPPPPPSIPQPQQRYPNAYQSSERGGPTRKSGGGGGRNHAQRAELDNEVDTSSFEGHDESSSSCIRCPKKRVVLVAGRGETKVALKLPENFRRCPGRRNLRGRKARALTRHGRFRGAQGDEHRSSEDNLTSEDEENIRLEALWGPALGTMAKEGRHETVFSLLRNNKALRTCHVTMIVKVQRCSPLLLPPNTRARCSQGTAWGSRCEFSCIRKSTQTTFIPADVKETTCEMMTVTGEMGWSHEPPACSEDSLPPPSAPEASDIEVSEDESCAMPFPPSEGTISCGDEDDSGHKETVPVGTICRYNCSPGYQIPPPQRHLATTKCLSGGDWSTAADPYCEKIVIDVKDTMLPTTSIISKHTRISQTTNEDTDAVADHDINENTF